MLIGILLLVMVVGGGLYLFYGSGIGQASIMATPTKHPAPPGVTEDSALVLPTVTPLPTNTPTPPLPTESLPPLFIPGCG